MLSVFLLVLFYCVEGVLMSIVIYEGLYDLLRSIYGKIAISVSLVALTIYLYFRANKKFNNPKEKLERKAPPPAGEIMFLNVPFKTTKGTVISSQIQAQAIYEWLKKELEGNKKKIIGLYYSANSEQSNRYTENQEINGQNKFFLKYQLQGSNQAQVFQKLRIIMQRSVINSPEWVTRFIVLPRPTMRYISGERFPVPPTEDDVTKANEFHQRFLGPSNHTAVVLTNQDGLAIGGGVTRKMSQDNQRIVQEITQGYKDLYKNHIHSQNERSQPVRKEDLAERCKQLISSLPSPPSSPPNGSSNSNDCSALCCAPIFSGTPSPLSGADCTCPILDFFLG